MSLLRSTRPLLVSSLCLSVVVLSSCNVQPYCFDCVDETLDAGRGDSGDSATDASRDANSRVDAPSDADLPDAWLPPDGCTLGATEVCNHFDDDCDTMIDEGVNTTTDIDNCGSCGHRCLYAHAFGECNASTCSQGMCQAGYYDINMMDTDGCEYHCSTTGTEICDRRDNDCNGVVDEGFMLQTDPMNCGICGRVCNLAHTTSSSCTMGACAVGGCMPGFVDRDGVAGNGCEYACTPSGGGTETCNRIDDDCDGNVDEGDPGGGGTCGSTTGICTQGTNHCVGGALTCMGGTSPGVESCNGMDDDCDGTVDDGNPGGGASCGNSTGVCLPGRQTCMAGSLQCVGGTGPTTEACDNIDNDCDGMVDNGDPGGGGSCGISTGACMPGVQHCMGGALACTGGVGPTLETCNTMDDDCDGTVDNGYDLMNDVRNCGSCGHVCSFPHAVSACMAGTCVVAACAGGYVNLDMSTTNPNGCEYMCSRTSATESCNGVDDNCNGMTDEGVTAPSMFCRQAGVCAGSTATCMGSMGFVCNYAARATAMGTVYETTETRCDAFDNDCDGLVNEQFPLLGTACNNMQMGACRRTGTFVCNGLTAIMCNAPSGSGSSTTESCNGVDDDCNGTVDDGVSARGTWTRVRPSGGAATGVNDYWIQSYEASRPGADAASQGTFSNMACSVAGVLPWTSVTPTEAQTACAAVGASLCTETQWQRACQSSAATACTWSETTSCGTYAAASCNGIDYDTGAAAGNQDALVTTSALSSTCGVPWSTTVTPPGTMFSGTIYNMSGNAQEWTAPRSAGVNPIRGGSYNDIASGMTCGFSFEVGGNTIRLPNTGFRCCRTTDPSVP
jgi:hypothetical protein